MKRVERDDKFGDNTKLGSRSEGRSVGDMSNFNFMQ